MAATTKSVSGVRYYGHRFYNANLGRFINRDPIEESGGINLYGFCLSDPINKWDYLGNDPGDNPYGEVDENTLTAGGHAGSDSIGGGGGDGMDGLVDLANSMSLNSGSGISTSSSSSDETAAAIASVAGTNSGFDTFQGNLSDAITSSLDGAVDVSSGTVDDSGSSAAAASMSTASQSSDAATAASNSAGQSAIASAASSATPGTVGLPSITVSATSLADTSGLVYGSYGGISGNGMTYAVGAPAVKMGAFNTTVTGPKESGTFEYGWSFSTSRAGAAGTVVIGVIIDRHFNVGLFHIGSVGAGTSPSADTGLYLGVSNAPNIFKYRGNSLDLSVSGGKCLTWT